MATIILRNTNGVLTGNPATRTHPPTRFVGGAGGDTIGDGDDGTWAELAYGTTTFSDPAETYNGVDGVTFTIDRLDPTVTLDQVTSIGVLTRVSFPDPAVIDTFTAVVPITFGDEPGQVPRPGPGDVVLLLSDFVRGTPLGDIYVPGLLPSLQSPDPAARRPQVTYATNVPQTGPPVVGAVVYDTWLQVVTAGAGTGTPRCVRQWPRDDPYGMGSGSRVYPPPRSGRAPQAWHDLWPGEVVDPGTAD